MKIANWVLRIIIALILLQTVFFKFTGAEESKQLFETLGMEPTGRLGSGLAELAAAVMVLAPATAAIGALLALGVMSGALVSHFTVLGINYNGDGGALFAMASIVFLASLATLYLHRTRIPVLGERFR